MLYIFVIVTALVSEYFLSNIKALVIFSNLYRIMNQAKYTENIKLEPLDIKEEHDYTPDSPQQLAEQDNDTTPSEFGTASTSANVKDEPVECLPQNQTVYKPFACNICHARFKLKKRLNIHTRKHSREPLYRCDICQKLFYRKDISLHMRSHNTEVKPYECDVCHTEFSHSASLTSHELTHEAKPYKCDVCDQQFHTKTNLTLHKRIHTGDRPYKCDVCQERFYTASVYNKHKLVHSEKKLFQCDVCQKEFTLNGNLTSHKRAHGRESVKM